MPQPDPQSEPDPPDDVGALRLYGIRPDGTRGPMTWDQLTDDERDFVNRFVGLLRRPDDDGSPHDA